MTPIDRFDERLDKAIRIAIVKGYNAGIEQNKTPLTYTLDTDKIGKPLYDMIKQETSRVNREILEIIDKVEESNPDSTGRYNACNEIREALPDLLNTSRT